MSHDSYSTWIGQLHRAERAVTDAIEQSTKLPDNPFVALSRLRVVARKLEESDLKCLKPPTELLHRYEDECVRERAEFWDRMDGECGRRGWSIDGSTDRRLVNRGIIIELVEDEIRVEELAMRFQPHAASVADMIAPEVEGLVPREFTAPKFMACLSSAYDMVPGVAAKSIESVYRATLMLVQKPVFWRSLQANNLVRLTRPAFRARLARLLALGTRAADGREMRFGTTIVAKDAWEIYSPGEERLVQVGRISFE